MGLQKQNIIDCNKTLVEFKESEQISNLFKDIRIIVVPKKVEILLKKKRIEKDLLKIHKDSNLAIEYCLVFLANLIDIQFDYNNNDKWKSLSSKVLLKLIPGSNARYKKVVDLLSSTNLSDSPIIEYKKNEKGTKTYEVGVSSIQYRLSSQFSNVGYKNYTIICEDLLKHRKKIQCSHMEEIVTNPIVANLLNTYPRVTFPSEEEILLEAKQLVKARYFNNKGKKLTILNGRKKNDLKNCDERVFYEDSLKSYKYLTDNGISIPIVSGERAGGRVYDSFNLMPSFIRNLIKIDNERVVNVDLKCLHPNLAIKLYGGKCKYITHHFIAENLGVDVKDIKIEHLSFFNKHPKQMKRSQLFAFYELHEPQMLNNLISDKNRYKFKITSQRMFKLEVEIMTECIKRLNKINVYPLYIFDALLVNHSNQNTVEFTMNEVIEEMGIYTIVGSHKSPAFIRMQMIKETQSINGVITKSYKI
jgi:hypothetical protein